ncbi:thioredoxin family protein [Macrococcoides caseolyticum]|uniref:thioredoxin family protein n=1 Tax=Macrococcoides caseolyticum TaxID=69966 RepID=UPI001F219D54|nr:thioredoxin family protein [Macrococcus caseolyticus]MCE4957422.1 thioredoxin family protein [Macrococcus caseolyticus]
MTHLGDYFNQGLTLEEYVNQMKVNKAEMHKIYETFELPEDDRLSSIKEKHLKVIVITEDWCGDAMMNLPVLMKIAEVTDMTISVTLRDSNPELMDQYLTNGSRSIPIFIFLNEQDEEYANWGPRAAKVQSYVTDVRKDLPAKDASDFEAKQKEVHHQIHEKYKNTPEFWNEVYESIIAQLTK